MIVIEIVKATPPPPLAKPEQLEKFLRGRNMKQIKPSKIFGLQSSLGQNL
jgi:hypothetical protein